MHIKDIPKSPAAITRIDVEKPDVTSLAESYRNASPIERANMRQAMLEGMSAVPPFSELRDEKDGAVALLEHLRDARQQDLEDRRAGKSHEGLNRFTQAVVDLFDANGAAASVDAGKALSAGQRAKVNGKFALDHVGNSVSGLVLTWILSLLPGGLAGLALLPWACSVFEAGGALKDGVDTILWGAKAVYDEIAK